MAIQPPAPKKIITPAEMATSLLAMPNLVKTGAETHEHILIYGAPKSGKTLWASFLAEFYYLIWLDGDKGLSTVITQLPDKLKSRIIPFRIPSNVDTPLFLQTLLYVLKGVQVNICSEHGLVSCTDCKTHGKPTVELALNQLPDNFVVIVDSQSEAAQNAINLAQRKYGGALASAPTPVDLKLDFDGWNYVKALMDKYGSFVKDLRKHLVAISHETMVKLEDGTLKLAPISGSDNTSRAFAKNFSTVVFARTVNGKHTYSTSSTFNNLIQTGSRMDIDLEAQTTPHPLYMVLGSKAEQHVQGSWGEWWLKSKTIKDFKEPEPEPKDVLPIEEK